MWRRIFEAMSDDPNHEYLIVDSTVVRAHQHATEPKKGPEDQAIGCFCGGLGCPVRFALTAGHRGDVPQVASLIEGLPGKVVMADTSNDADHFRQAIA